MQPREFAAALLEWICADGAGRARTFADAAYTDAPHGVQLALPSGAVVFLQVVGRAAPGIRVDHSPVHADPPPVTAAPELPTSGLTELAEVERWLVWRITHARSTQIKTVGVFHGRTGRRAIPHGLQVDFHSGARAWVYFRHATPAGREPGGGPVWRALGTV